ncbi:unnamed protein product [Rhizoctonia solani]|uniref:MYND-type domain-containing protein n=1 Tax=Rhizoctonia solani TaxID=456999 RepID=A0A8H3DDC3_9AGAM|nr:unnamed protein product [Rhizoctonia solani]
MWLMRLVGTTLLRRSHPHIMDSEVDQHWGRPLEQYAASYGITNGARVIVSWEIEEEAQLVKEAMYGQILNAHGPVEGMGNFLGANDITLPMLETVLKLAHSPRHLDFFADPVFIGGCIRLLAQIRPEGRPSPFSHELGYLCFRIIVIGIGAWILKITENLDMTIAAMETDLRIGPLLVFSGHVSRALEKVIFEMAGRASCDWIMGWARTPGHTNPERFLLPTDLRSLLNILWEDRKLYLRALLTTYFPGLSGIMFVLWRFLDVNPAVEAGRPTELMVVPFCELLWRSMLAATADQLALLAYISSFVQQYKRADLWDKSPKYIDLDDSRTLLYALNTRMAPADLRFFAPLCLWRTGVVWRFVTQSIQPGSEDLFPALFGGTMGCIWRGIEEGDLKPPDIVEKAGSVFASLGKIITPLNHPNHPNGAVVEDLVAELEKHDFIELLARLIILLKPGEARSTLDRSVSRNTMFINNTLFLVRTLAQAAPTMLLGNRLRQQAGDWSKMNCKLLMYELLGPSHAPKAHKALHRESKELWAEIAQILELNLWTGTLARHDCSYSRCPYGKGILPVEFMCTRCHDFSFRYCSTQCQMRD